MVENLDVESPRSFRLTRRLRRRRPLPQGEVKRIIFCETFRHPNLKLRSAYLS
jgi:hypothetical protein